MQMIVVAGFIIVHGLAAYDPPERLPAWLPAAVAGVYLLLTAALGQAAAGSGMRLLLRGWRTLVGRLLGPLAAAPLAEPLLEMLPFFAAIILCWWTMYPLDRAL